MSKPPEDVSDPQARTLPPSGLGHPSLVLILKGGGVNGLALAGAVAELQRLYRLEDGGVNAQTAELETLYRFDTFVGTSAGAMAAALLAAGYSGEELVDKLSRKDFGDFTPEGLEKLWSFFTTRSRLRSGNEIETWLEELLTQRPELAETKELRLDQLYKNTRKRLVIVVGGHETPEILVDSQDPDALANESPPVKKAVRASMTIPHFFPPVEFRGQRICDGGIAANFPLASFLQRNPQFKDGPRRNQFLGLYLKEKLPASENWVPIQEAAENKLREDQSIIDECHPRVIVIDPSPVKTTDFDLSGQEKSFLVQEGRAAVLEHLAQHHGDQKMREKLAEPAREARAQAQVLRAEAETAREQRRRARVAAGKRRRKKARRWLLGAGLTGAGLIALAVIWSLLQPSYVVEYVDQNASTVIVRVRNEGWRSLQVTGGMLLLEHEAVPPELVQRDQSCRIPVPLKVEEGAESSALEANEEGVFSLVAPSKDYRLYAKDLCSDDTAARRDIVCTTPWKLLVKAGKKELPVAGAFDRDRTFILELYGDLSLCGVGG